MRPLPTNYQVLTWLCICPADADNQLKKPLYILISLIFLVTNISGLFSSGIFFIRHFSIDPRVSLNAAYQIAAFWGVTYMSIIAFLMRNDITAFLGKLQVIYDKCKWIFNVDLLQIFWFNWLLILKKEQHRLVMWWIDIKCMNIFVSISSDDKHNFRWKWGIFRVFGESKPHQWTDLALLLPICDWWILCQHDNSLYWNNIVLSVDTSISWHSIHVFNVSQ